MHISCTHPSKVRLVQATFPEGAILLGDPKSFQPQIDPPPLRSSFSFILVLFLFLFLLFPVFSRSSNNFLLVDQ